MALAAIANALKFNIVSPEAWMKLAAVGGGLMIDPDNLAGPNSTVDLRYTYANGKYICSRTSWFSHIYWVYVVIFSSVACFVTIAIGPLKWLHVWMGRLYIFAMIMATASALLIFNTGLPVTVLYSFAYTNVALAIGWCAIKFHQARLRNSALALVEARYKDVGMDGAFSLKRAFEEAKNDLGRARSWAERFFSLKAFHGVVMFLSCESLFGRIQQSNQTGDFTCYTFPAYKPVNASQYRTEGMNLAGMPIQMLPIDDPNADRLPWVRLGGDVVWAIIQFANPVLVALVFGSLFAYFSAQRENKVD